MAAWVEFEDHGIAYGRLNSVWVVDKFAVVTHFDGVLGRPAGSGEKDEKEVEELEVSHFGIDKVAQLLNTLNCATCRFTDFGRSRAKRPWVNSGLYILLVLPINTQTGRDSTGRSTKRGPRTRLPDIGHES